MRRARYIAIGVIAILAIVVGVCLILVSTKTSEVSWDIPSDATLLDVRYEKPEWLEGHLKQRSVEEYIKTRKYEAIEDLEDMRWQVHTRENEQSIGIRILFPPYAVASFSEGTITYTF